MCTVTWLPRPDGYHLLCNRDERDSRQPALGPRIHEQNGVKYIAPVDGDHGGSWIGTNEFGMSLCLLNRYGDVQSDENREYISRGLLLIDLLDCSEVEQVTLRISDVDLSRFRPFNLLVLPRSAESALLEWTGSKFSIVSDVESFVPLTSTSLTEPGVAVERRLQFAAIATRQGLNEDSLDDYHRSHLPTRGSYSVCMHRDGAATVSLSKVSVTPVEIVFAYESGSPCESTSVTTVRLVSRNQA
jgi:transport and Golgi organization protein 2